MAEVELGRFDQLERLVTLEQQLQRMVRNQFPKLGVLRRSSRFVAPLLLALAVFSSCEGDDRPGARSSPSAIDALLRAMVPTAPEETIWITTESGHAVQAVNSKTGKIEVTIPISGGFPRTLTVGPNGFLYVPLGPAWSIATVDPGQRVIKHTAVIPTNRADALIENVVREAGGQSFTSITHDALGATFFRNDLVVAAEMETNANVPPFGALVWPKDGTTILLPDIPHRIQTLFGRIVAPILGRDLLVLFDGKKLTSVKVGDGARGVAAFRGKIAVTAARAGLLSLVDPKTARVESQMTIPWSRPSGVAVWRDKLVVAAEGSMGAPEGALVVIDPSTKKTSTIRFGEIRYASEVLVIGDLAYVTSVDDNLLVVVDLVQEKLVAAFRTERRPMTPLLL